MAEQELKVLLIEDNPGDAFLIKFYLGESTSPIFDVIHAETVKGALELLETNKFDLILSDMNLPDSFGMDTIKSILGKFPGNLVIVLTGLTDEDVGLETVRYGAQDFLVKGKFDGKVLVSSVLFAFERFKLNKQIDTVSEQLGSENFRFDFVQRLLNMGYIEFESKTSLFYASDNTNFILGLGEEKIDTLDSFVNLFENATQLKTNIFETLEKEEKGELRCTQKKDDKTYRLLFESTPGKFSAIVQNIS